MALSSPAPRPPSPKEKRVASEMKHPSAEETKPSTRKRPRPDNKLTRQVSNEAICENSEMNESSSAKGRGSPCRCVSEFDCASLSDEKQSPTSGASFSQSPPNPLHNAKVLEQHNRALTLESELFPMRLILARLMAHGTHNRKGIFNSPVDPVALKLPDYFQVIKSPMDLGTVKARLHAVAYKSRVDVANDIRLVFRNAMVYNPPKNLVHICARALLAFFEDHVECFVPDLAVEPVRASTTQESYEVDSSTSPLQTKDAPVSQRIRIPSATGKDVTSHMSGPPSPPYASQPHCQATRTQLNLSDNVSQTTAVGNRKRKKRGSKVNATHSCQWCEGHVCGACQQACLHLEPTLLICNGAPCSGAKIRKNAVFYIAPDGSRQYCQRCYTGLPAVLPNVGAEADTCRYKRDLLKRKNDEEVVESWIACKDCSTSFHRVCVMYDDTITKSRDFRCLTCCARDIAPAATGPVEEKDLFSFVTGEDLPTSLIELFGSDEYSKFRTAHSLPETPMSSFIQRKVQERMAHPKCPNAEKTISIRVISDCNRFFDVPEVVRRHFKVREGGEETAPPLKVGYRSKAIALFQRIDGLDVCIFCMYVQEYSGEDTYETTDLSLAKKKRVYIAYLDSVEHFRPRARRTEVYHEILVAYLASARERGYESAHIWACPPSRGNSFVFWNHPSSQRTPSRERLISWYHGAISRAISCGVVTDVKSLYETNFGRRTKEDSEDISSTVIGRSSTDCPPLFDGDFWIEESMRLHTVAMSRISKSKSCTEIDLPESEENCPARQLAFLLRRIMEDPVSTPFRKPVNAAALKLKDYHKVISKPMDLGTIYSRCLLGEYRQVRRFVADIDLVVANAKRYNPAGHFVHTRADELAVLVETELNKLASTKWDKNKSQHWRAYQDLSLSLDFQVKTELSNPSNEIVEPVRSADLRHSVCSPFTTQLTDGPKAVEERMAGEDKWMIEKKGLSPPKPQPQKRKKGADEEPPPKRRRQTWLGDEVGEAVRRLRTSFFTCSLVADQPTNEYDNYVAGMVLDQAMQQGTSSTIVDARHGFLEFSQARNLEFDTLRRAKYSTATLLFYLHNENAPGTVPHCSCCNQVIEDVRWHKVRKVLELKKSGGRPPACRKPVAPEKYLPEELCTRCHSKHPHQNLFVPLQVTLRGLDIAQ